MSAIAYCDGSYRCTVCQATLEIPAGANVRQGFTTVHDGTRERVLFVDGHEAHRCRDDAIATFGRSSPAKRRR